MLASIAFKMGETKSNLTEKCTERLLSQHQDINDSKLITADRIGYWHFHMGAIQQALPIFAATGHFRHTKSAYPCLQSIMNLELTNKRVQSR